MQEEEQDNSNTHTFTCLLPAGNLLYTPTMFEKSTGFISQIQPLRDIVWKGEDHSKKQNIGRRLGKLFVRHIQTGKSEATVYKLAKAI